MILAQRITDAMAQPYLIHGHPLFVPASVGARRATAGEDAKATLRQADEAMYAVKLDRPRRSIIARPSVPIAAVVQGTASPSADR